MVYQWKSGTRISADAQIAGEMCAELEKEGRLTAKNLLEANREDDAPLHDVFNWNDSEAAELYREDQARYIIRSIVVKKENVAEPIRQFIHVDVNENKYHSVDILLSKVDTRDSVLKMALAELQAFRKKYQGLEELAKVFAAIDQLKIDEVA